jgi:inner membrane protein
MGYDKVGGGVRAPEEVELIAEESKKCIKDVHREGHLGVNLAAYAPVAFVLVALDLLRLAFIGGGVMVALAMLPDYDQQIPFVKHRGITHTVWFALVVGAVVGVVGFLVGDGVGASLGYAAFGFVLGTLSVVAHLLGDVITPAGIRPLTPYDDRRVTFDLVKAKNPLANYGLLVVGAVLVAAFAGLGNVLSQ